MIRVGAALGVGLLNETPQHSNLLGNSFNEPQRLEVQDYIPTLRGRRVRFVLLLLAWLQKRTQINGNTYAKEDSAVGVSHSWTGREDLSRGRTGCVV